MLSVIMTLTLLYMVLTYTGFLQRMAGLAGYAGAVERRTFEQMLKCTVYVTH